MSLLNRVFYGSLTRAHGFLTTEAFGLRHALAAQQSRIQQQMRGKALSRVHIQIGDRKRTYPRNKPGVSKAFRVSIFDCPRL